MPDLPMYDNGDGVMDTSGVVPNTDSDIDEEMEDDDKGDERQ